jgi:hypothetical protein
MHAAATTAKPVGMHDVLREELSRLQVQYFKAAWMANVLHEGTGDHRSGGNDTTDGDKVAKRWPSEGRLSNLWIQ